MTRPSKLVTVTRVVLGLLFLFSGLNHLVSLVPMPPMGGDTARFWQGLVQTGYFFPLLGVVEVVAAGLLLWGRLVPVALAILAPVIVNATAFHVALAPQGLPVMVVALAASLLLAWRHRPAFASLLRARAVRSHGVRAVELVMGLVLLASGLAGLLGRTPPPSTAGAAVMMEGLAAAGYFMPMLALVLIGAGALLVAGRFVGVALVIAAPLVVQILAYRLYVATPGMLVVGLALVAAQIWLALSHRELFAPLFGGPSGGRPAMVTAPQAA
jgi:putative oxidoreductase